MHGLALLLTTACLGVDFGWDQQGDQLDYVIQIEPALLEQLKEGELVFNDIPPDVRGGRRFVLRVGTGEVPRRGRQVVPVAGGFGQGAESVPRPAVIRAPVNNPNFAAPAFDPGVAAPGNFAAGGPAVPIDGGGQPRVNLAPGNADPRLIPLPAAGPGNEVAADNALPPVPGFGPPELPAGARGPVRPPLVDPLGAVQNPPVNNPLPNNPPLNPPLVNNPPPLNNPQPNGNGNWNGQNNGPFNNNPPFNNQNNGNFNVPPFNNPPFNNPNNPPLNPVRDPWNNGNLNNGNPNVNDPWANRNPMPAPNPASPPWNGGFDNRGLDNQGNWNNAQWRDQLASRDPMNRNRWDTLPNQNPNGPNFNGQNFNGQNYNGQNFNGQNSGYQNYPGYPGYPGYGTPASYYNADTRGGFAKAAMVVKDAHLNTTAAAATAARASPAPLPSKTDHEQGKTWWPLLLTGMGFFLSFGGNMYLWWTWWDSHRRYLNLIGELRTARTS